MNKIEEFYANRNMMAKYFPEEVLKQKEAEVIQGELASGIREAVEQLLSHVTIPLSVQLEYRPEVGVKVDVSLMDDTEADDQEAESETEEKETPESSRSESIGFTVRFPDGTEVQRKYAKETMIATLKVIGMHKVAAFRGRMFKGYPLVSRNERTGVDFKCQELVDGWYVYVNMSNDTKMDVLRQISEEFGLGLKITDDTGKVVTDADTIKKGKPGKRVLYKFNGEGPYSKRELVLLAVTQFVMEHYGYTYAQLEQVFPKNLQGSYGVIRPISWIEDKAKLGTDHKNRYYMDKKDVLTSADGVHFAVCKEWGDNFANFVQQVEGLGWKVTED